MMGMGIEIGIEMGTGGDGDDDFSYPIHDDRAQLFFHLPFSFPFLYLSFFFSLISFL